jgi:hypothetical protein
VSLSRRDFCKYVPSAILVGSGQSYGQLIAKRGAGVVAAGGGGTIAFISNAKASAATNNPATTTGADTTGANLLVVVAVTYGSSAASGSATVTDSKSNTWTSLTDYTNGNSHIAIWYAKNATVGASHTFTLTPHISGGYPTIFASWWSGANTTAPQDQANGAASATGTTLQPGSITPGTNNQLVITGISDNDNGNKTVSAGFTRQDINQNNSFECGAWAYQIQTTATAVNPTWTEGTNNVARATAIVSFKP